MIDADNEILLSCNCHGYHYIEFWYDEDFGLQIVFVERPKRFLDRVRSACNALRGKDVYGGDLIVEDRDYEKIVDILGKGVKK